ncbi:cytochrome P450 26A1-like [Saccoglossus kowalevskii]|uniref:Cytochrome P450 26A1-like n=1 Tax=Saccoglossus kowalevskii TaxID=10224 RepID=A0ABM0GQ60_SACKO|nr:PREDICTED: cytochrome P450 26A1-like [Saccoglossus kowalevskii]
MQVILGSVLSPALPLLLPCVLLILICKLWTVYNIRSKDPNCKAPLPEGSMGIPFFGETLQLVFQGAEFYHTKLKKHGRVFKTHVLGMPSVRVIGAENIRKILQGEGDIVVSHQPATIRGLLGNRSIATSQGQAHTRLRKLAAKAFHINSMSKYIPYIQRYAREAVQNWSERGQVDGWDEILILVFRMSGKLICDFNYEDPTELQHAANICREIEENMFTLPINIPGSPFNKVIRARNIMYAKIEASLHKKRNSNCGQDEDCVDVLRILAQEKDEHGNTIDLKQLKELALELILLGHVSPSSAIVMMLIHLAKHPDVVERVRMELEQHNLLDEEAPLTFGTLSILTYTSCVVKEVLRVSPPVGAGFRKVLKTFELEGKQIPAGWMVLFSIRETQANAENFTKSVEFDPDRFMPGREENKKGDRFNYVPFGAGPRSCVGKQMGLVMMKILLIELTRRCRWELVKPEKLKIKFMPSPHPVNGLPLRFNKIDRNVNSADFEKSDIAGDIAC